MSGIRRGILKTYATFHPHPLANQKMAAEHRHVVTVRWTWMECELCSTHCPIQVSKKGGQKRARRTIRRGWRWPSCGKDSTAMHLAVKHLKHSSQWICKSNFHQKRPCNDMRSHRSLQVKYECSSCTNNVTKLRHRTARFIFLAWVRIKTKLN